MSLVDDEKLSLTKDYTSTIELLRLLHNSLVKTLETWTAFENGELDYFNAREQETLHDLWNAYLADIEKDVNQLRSLQRTLQQRTEMFEAMRNGASTLKEYA